MRRVLKKQIQEAVRRIDFPIIAYVYETGRIAAVSLRAKFVIGESIKNINFIWEQNEKEKFPEEILKNGNIIKYQKFINCNNDRLMIDTEFVFVEIGDEHLVFMVFEQSYKRVFDNKYRQKIPRIIWCNQKLEIIGCNEAAQKDRTFLKDGKGDSSESISQQRHVIESGIGQFDKIQEVTVENGERSFASMNRILLTNKNNTHIGVLSIYTLILSVENTQEIIDDAYRENNILNEAVSKGNHIAVSWEKGSKGIVDYISPNIIKLGYTTRDFYSGKLTWKDVVIPEDYELFEHKNKEPNDWGGNCFFVDYRVKKKNGDIIWVRDETIKSTIKDITKFRQGIVYTIEKPVTGNSVKEREESFHELIKDVKKLDKAESTTGDLSEEEVSKPEFSLFYQPIIDNETRTCTGAEALLRWKNKEKGVVSPEVFLPLSEYLGLMGPIGNFVFRQAFEALYKWNKEGYPDFNIHINLSVIQLTQPDIIEKITNAADEAGINRKNVVFEVKESLALEDLELMKAVLHSLKREGFRLLLDNFGRGISALNVIMELPFDYIKIDESFIRTYGTEKFKPNLLLAIGELAHSFNMKVIVSGIETRQQLEFLILSEIDQFQGYYFGYPMPIENFKMKGEYT